MNFQNSPKNGDFWGQIPKRFFGSWQIFSGRIFTKLSASKLIPQNSVSLGPFCVSWFRVFRAVIKNTFSYFHCFIRTFYFLDIIKLVSPLLAKLTTLNNSPLADFVLISNICMLTYAEFKIVKVNDCFFY